MPLSQAAFELLPTAVIFTAESPVFATKREFPLRKGGGASVLNSGPPTGHPVKKRGVPRERFGFAILVLIKFLGWIWGVVW